MWMVEWYHNRLTIHIDYPCRLVRDLPICSSDAGERKTQAHFPSLEYLQETWIVDVDGQAVVVPLYHPHRLSKADLVSESV